MDGLEESSNDNPQTVPMAPNQDRQSKSLIERLKSVKDYLIEDKFVLIGVIIIGVLIIFGGGTILIAKLQTQSVPQATPIEVPVDTSSPASTSIDTFKGPTVSPIASSSASPAITPTTTPNPTASASQTSSQTNSSSASTSPTPSPTPSTKSYTWTGTNVNVTTVCSNPNPAYFNITISGSVPAQTGGNGIWTTLISNVSTIIVSYQDGSSTNIAASFNGSVTSVRNQSPTPLNVSNSSGTYGYELKVYSAPYTDGIPTLTNQIGDVSFATDCQ